MNMQRKTSKQVSAFYVSKKESCMGIGCNRFILLKNFQRLLMRMHFACQNQTYK